MSFFLGVMAVALVVGAAGYLIGYLTDPNKDKNK